MTLKTIAILAVGATLCALYYFVDPVGEAAAYVPKCALRTLTGWECPGCGAQRAFHALLHGRFREAFMLNPFLWGALAYVGAIFLTRATGHVRLYARLCSPVACGIYLALYVVWWVVRNTLTL